MKLDMLTVHDIHKLHVAKFMHKVSNQCETTNHSPYKLNTQLLN